MKNDQIIRHSFVVLPGPTSKPLTKELEEKFANCCLFIDDPSDSEKVPLPWDAGFKIHADTLVLEGSAGAHGWGSVEVQLPLKDLGKGSHAEIRFYVEVDPREEIARDVTEDFTVEDILELERLGFGVFRGQQGDDIGDASRLLNLDLYNQAVVDRVEIAFEARQALNNARAKLDALTTLHRVAVETRQNAKTEKARVNANGEIKVLLALLDTARAELALAEQEEAKI